ncbi:type II secretion system protein [Massilia sp. TS11]|uniref:type II secretion system protein n=1 Tax=Massilia sp. TS11 TaxID=2908003 RepID=UPI001EDA028E|nr:type II secretion system protein [Massilia sp. TS11]MCG2583858.1 type II secretion system protein [Massilia sp. TS11]
MRERGFSYVVMMFVVAIAGLVAARAVENSLTNERREKEADLLYVGQAYRNAIASYYENSPGTFKQYPAELSDLLLDSRTSTMRRHLRKLFRDPITGDSKWGVLRDEDGRVVGVFSLSEREPVKQGGFAPELASFTGMKRYMDWKFVYQPQ